MEGSIRLRSYIWRNFRFHWKLPDESPKLRRFWAVPANQIVLLVEKVGIPLLVAMAAAWGLWKLLQYILKDFKGDFLQKHDDLEREIIETKQELLTAIVTLRTMAVQQVDRVRTVERNIYRFQDAVRTKLNMSAQDYENTRKEKYDEAKAVLEDVGKINGD